MAGSAPPAGKKLTLIFFSWTWALSTDSHYCRCVSFAPNRLQIVDLAGTYDSLNIVEFLIARDDDGLDEELITTLGIQWRVLLHRL